MPVVNNYPMTCMDQPPILYEDNHLVAVNKMPGVLSQGDRTGDRSILDLMKAYIKERDAKPGRVFLGLPHRLDRPASGTLVLAKTSKALSRLTASFRDQMVTKIYWAVVEAPPNPPEGSLVDWLLKDGKTNASRRVGAMTKGSKEARLDYRLLGASKSYWLVEVQLFTGRHHQVRVQLSGLGCPIKGDLKYGAKRSNPNGGIHLHARRLELPHPVREETIAVTAPLPDEPVWRAFSAELNE